MIYDGGTRRFMTVMQLCGQPFAFTKAPTPENRRRLKSGIARYLREQQDMAERGSLDEQIALANASHEKEQDEP